MVPVLWLALVARRLLQSGAQRRMQRAQPKHRFCRAKLPADEWGASSLQHIAVNAA